MGMEPSGTGLVLVWTHPRGVSGMNRVSEKRFSLETTFLLCWTYSQLSRAVKNKFQLFMSRQSVDLCPAGLSACRLQLRFNKEKRASVSCSRALKQASGCGNLWVAEVLSVKVFRATWRCRILISLKSSPLGNHKGRCLLSALHTLRHLVLSETSAC